MVSTKLARGGSSGGRTGQAGRISLPSEGSRSPSTNIALGRGATVREVVGTSRRTGGVFSRGGGGSSSSGKISGPSAAQIASQKLISQKAAKDKADREQRARDTEQARQSKIQAGTIGGQLGMEQEPDGFRIGLSEREKRLTTREVIGQRFTTAGKEIGGGLVTAGAVLTEGAVSLAGAFGTQTIAFDEGGKRIDQSFRFSEEGFIGRQKAKPLTVGKFAGEAIIFAPLVVSAVGGFIGGVSAQGLKQTVIETATQFNPFQIRQQTFGALSGGKGAIDDLKFDVASFKQTAGDTTKRLVVGRARDFDDVFLLSKQISSRVGGKDVSSAVTDITAPTTTFRTGRFTSGVQTVRTESIAGGLGGGGVGRVRGVDGLRFSQTLEGVTGGAGRVVTRTRANLLFDEASGLTAEFNLGALQFKPAKTSGAISKSVGDDGLSIFQSGRGRRVDIIGRDVISKKVRVDEFNIRGVEFDIGAIGGKQQFGVSAGISSGKGGGASLDITAKQLSASISDIAPVVSAKNGFSAVRQVVSTTGGIFGLPSAFAGTGQFETTAAQQVFGGAQELIRPTPQGGVSRITDTPLVDLGADISSLTDVSPRSRVTTRTRGRTRQEFARDPALEFRPAVDIAVDLGVEQIFKQPPALRQRAEQDFFKPQPDPFLGFAGGGFPGLIPGLGAGGLVGTFPGRRKKQKGRRLTERIAPSLTGQVLFDIGDITGGPLEISGRGGRSPFDIRLVPTQRKKKKKK